jgi:hypothetical protein
MHVVVNQKLVRGRVRIASALHLAALAIFALGLWFSLTYGEEQILASYASIIVGLILYNFGQIFLRRWGPRFRQDGVLAKALRGLDNRHTFLGFVSSKLPDYLLVGPGGVQVIVARSHTGTVVCRNDRWSRESRGGVTRLFSFFGGNPLGDPGLDLSRGTQRVREHLDKAGVESAPIGGVVVFTNQDVKLRMEGCSHPVTRLRQLRGNVGGNRGALNQQGIARVVDALKG